MRARLSFLLMRWEKFSSFCLALLSRAVGGEGYGAALMYNNSKVAQPAHRVKDKRLRRAFGILDTARRLGFVIVKGLLPTPVKQG